MLDALAKAGKAGDRLWEENWDDDDIEDDFTKQLRCVVLSGPLAIFRPGGSWQVTRLMIQNGYRYA